MPRKIRPFAAASLLALLVCFGCAKDPEVVRAERLSLLADLEVWDAATPEERRAAAVEVDRELPEFAFRGLETFTCGDQTHEVAVFDHATTGLAFSLVPGGSFSMGSRHDDPDRVAVEARHHVTLKSPFLICRTEVTQAVWEAIAGANPARFQGAERPVELISWEQARAFCNGLDLELPTEAQWEYAARAGSDARYSFGDDAAQLGSFGHVQDPDGDGTRPVAQLAPNAFGLYDVHGNVWEWCRDWFAPFDTAAATDPTGPVAPTDLRILKGGSWDHKAAYARCAARGMHPPDRQAHRLGLRPVRTLAPR